MRKKGCKQREVGGVMVLYPASGFQSDVEMLLQRFVESKSIRYEEFSRLWRESNFSLVHLGRNGIRERRDFLEEAFRIIVQYVLPPYSLQVRVGGLYLLNGMYRTQRVNPPLRIRVPLSCWKDFEKLRSEIVDQKHLDAVYILRQLVSERAFFICAFTTMLSVDEVYTENDSSSSSGRFGSSGWGEEPSLLSRLQDDGNVGQLHALHEKYHELKCKFNASRGGSANDPGSSLNLIKPNLVESILTVATESKSQPEESEQLSLSSPDKSANERALKIRSLKQRAQETKVSSSPSRSTRNMETSSLSRLSPPRLSPPPGLLPTLPVASTPTSFSAAMSIKQEQMDRPSSRSSAGCRSSESPFPSLPMICNNVKMEKLHREADKVSTTFEPTDNTSDSQLLKQRLEMYWQEMVKYQQQLQQENSAKQAMSNNNSYEEENESIQQGQQTAEVLNRAKSIVQKMIQDDNKTMPKNSQLPWPSLAVLAANRQLRSPKSGQNNHISNLSPPVVTQNSLQHASFLSQQAIAAMLSLQHMQQQQMTMADSNHASLGNLLPPPPTLLSENMVSNSSHLSPCPMPPSTSSNAYQQINTVNPKLSTSCDTSLSSGSILNLSKIESTNRSPLTLRLNEDGMSDQGSDSPLDLSMPVGSRKRARDSRPTLIPKSAAPKSQPPPLLFMKHLEGQNQVTPSNAERFPEHGEKNLLNQGIPVIRSHHTALENHIKNGLSGISPPTSGGPFTSLYLNQEMPGQMLQAALAAAGGKTLNELVENGIPPHQIQQWLRAAVSVQQAQQMAFNQLSFMQHQQAQQKLAAPPKKRPRLTNNLGGFQQSPLSKHSGFLQHQDNMYQPHTSNPLLTPNNYNQRGSNHLTPTSNTSQKSSSSPTISPNQNHTGKRYRRYAKPPYSYVSLISLSILSSREKKLRLSQILKRISEMFPFFNGSYQGWRDSVRHNLSQNECFVKVLKNPYRPTAKGNFWTVNLSSIPHELLLRQNTLVSRYAQDSGYRYRKDLSEVFDLHTGALKVPVPRHLLRDSETGGSSPLADDPASVMEAILLEETSDDESSDMDKDKIPPEQQQFTLEDLFNQSDDGEDDSMLGRGRNGRGKQQSAHATPPSLLPQATAFSAKAPFLPLQPLSSHPGTVNNFQASLHSRVVDAQRLALKMMPHSMLSSNNNPQSNPLPIPNNVVSNPFVTAQTEFLTKALANQLQGQLSNFQKILYSNQALQKLNVTASVDFNTPPVSKSAVVTLSEPSSPTSGSCPTPSPESNQKNTSTDNQQSVSYCPVSSQKRNKRKGIQPVRRTAQDGEDLARMQVVETRETPAMSPPSSLFAIPAPSLTPSRSVSSEAESSAAPSNPFSSPPMSSSSKSHSSSPRHDDSSEFEENHQHPTQTLFSLQGGAESAAGGGISGLQALQMYKSQSLQASKMT